MKALLTTGDPKSLDDTKIVYGVLKPMLSFQQGFDTLNAACCTLRDEGDAIFKSVRDMPKYSRFAQALFTAGCPFGAAMLGFDLLSTVRQGEELAKLEAARDFCDERIARIGAVLAIGHAALYDRAVMQSFRNHVSAAYTQSEDAGNQAVFDITSRNLFFPKSWTPFLCKKTDFLPLV
jgi:hypothetical protein